MVQVRSRFRLAKKEIFSQHVTLLSSRNPKKHRKTLKISATFNFPRIRWPSGLQQPRTSITTEVQIAPSQGIYIYRRNLFLIQV
jgi:hypothetical protein